MRHRQTLSRTFSTFWTSKSHGPLLSSQQLQENAVALEAAVTAFWMGDTISSSVASLSSAGGVRKAMPVRPVLSGQIFQTIPKGGGLGRTQSSSEVVDYGDLGSRQTMATASGVLIGDTRGYVWAQFVAPLAVGNLIW